MRKNKLVKPILKWVGGKRQLLDEIDQRLPKKISYYVEPFVGGGAVLFDKQPQHARINDYNEELINVYRVVKDNPNELIKELAVHEEKNEQLGSEWFYHVRGLDRESNFDELSNVEKAARIIYLNKTCFNGLFRVNSAGQLNVPYGRYKHPNIVNEVGIRALHKYFSEADIDMRQGDFAECLKDLPKGAFVYLDPPYMPITATSAFTGYTQEGFGYDEQVRLRDECIKLREQGIHFLQSNSDCEEIRELYKDFKIETVAAKRSINSRGDRRGAVKEVLISG
ncbi:DNA adenine methylase [uncultured Rothia sp.]|uniref:DNA adenine methylase n=1 Tax=Rothia mucilaginosa TaxID=43675 RepID=UPI0025EA4FD6|nr:DNA adenine methylase [uncultured Rothia sp.]